MPWINEPPLLTARQGLAAATCDAPAPAAGYRVYAIGGDDGITGAVATVEAYDTLAKTWSTITPMLTPRLNLGATSGVGRIYAIGGSTGTAPLAAHEIYDPAANTWASAPPLPTARSGLSAVTGRDGLIYALGGYDGSYLTTVEAFDPATNSWTARASMPTARSGLAVVVGPDGLIYAIGGQNSTATLAIVEVFNPSTNSWTAGPSILASRYGLAAAVGPDGLIYALGGVDDSGIPQTTVYGLDPTTPGPWTAQAPLLTAQSFFAADTGPDGLIYAIGGQNFASPTLSTVEAFSSAKAATAPDPYIGNGSYQSPDIILLDSSENPVPIGGAPSGAWDTLLQPNTDYGIQAVIYNDANVAAPNTIVRFWSFPGGVGTAGSLIDMQKVTVPPNGSTVVTSANPFLSGPAGAHECVAVSVANAASNYFNIDPMTAAQVIDPTVPHPAGSGHFGSAWRNTNSVAVGAGMGLKLGFHFTFPGLEPAEVKLAVSATRVPVGWERAGEAADLSKALAGSGAALRLPLFLLPELRRRLPEADLDLKIHVQDAHGDARHPAAAETRARAHPGELKAFTVSGTIPSDAKPGEIFLMNVAAHYPRRPHAEAKTVEYLSVIYVKQKA